MGIIDEIVEKYGFDNREQYTEDKYQEFLEEYDEVLNDHHGEEPTFEMRVDLSSFADDTINERAVIIGDILQHCTISVWGGEKVGIPHFHLTSDSPVRLGKRTKKFDSCVKLHRAEFYPHYTHRDTFIMLGKSEAKDAAICLNNFLCSPDRNGRTKRQMWAVLVEEWFASNPHLQDVHGLRTMNKPNYNNCLTGGKDD